VQEDDFTDEMREAGLGLRRTSADLGFDADNAEMVDRVADPAVQGLIIAKSLGL